MRYAAGAALAVLTLAAVAAPAGAPQSAAPAQTKKESFSPADPLPRRGFNIVLLVGDMQGPGYPKPIPEAAMRALADMRDFLPYKGYSLLDTQWIIGGTSSPAVTRLRGLDGQEYEMELRASPLLTPGTAAPDQHGMSVRFVLRDVDTGTGAGAESGRTPLHPKELAKAEPAAAEVAREIFQLERERTDLQIQVEHKRRNVEVGIGDPVEVQRMQMQLTAVTRRIQDLKQQAGASAAKATGRAVIDTSFRMDNGETVIVGTSKMKGGSNALIALLTATSDRPKASTK
jgi:hypothetical protein